MKNERKAVLLPFESFREKEAFSEIKKVIEAELSLKAVVAGESIAEPKSVFSLSGGKIDADLLLSYLQKCTEKNILAVFTGNELGCSDSDFVFGAAIVNGVCCVVSSSGFEGNTGRIAKEALHEIGHCLGLTHCKNACAMRFSSSVEDIDLKPAKLCSACKKFLAAKNI
ncbi:MAG: hypothetical protein J7K00_05580 [Candidatus Diapherotrites archaeon]|nr:hypothetical protein [Candidatus Diapherotrites archaeon]